MHHTLFEKNYYFSISFQKNVNINGWKKKEIKENFVKYFTVTYTFK